MEISKEQILKSAAILTEGGLVAIPTETVYGLAGNAFNEKAIEKIFKLKGRPLYNPLIVHIGKLSDLANVVNDIPEKASTLMTAFWPGPLTLVLKKHANIPKIVTGGHDTVAVRMPNHKFTLALLQQLPFPLAAPSANKFGGISPTTASHVRASFKTQSLFILDGGNCEKGIESTIVGFQEGEPVLYRHGSVSVAELEKVCGPIQFHTKDEVAPVASGMLSKHYAPNTKTYFIKDVKKLAASFDGKRVGLLLFNQILQDASVFHQEVLSPTSDLIMAAKNLYAALHKLDAMNLDIIIAEHMPNEGIGKTINDRLQRAST